MQARLTYTPGHKKPLYTGGGHWAWSLFEADVPLAMVEVEGGRDAEVVGSGPTLSCGAGGPDDESVGPAQEPWL